MGMQTLGPREEGKARRHCCGFAANEGTYLGYLGDAQGAGSIPHSSGCQHLATGTCRLSNVFISPRRWLARFPPHSLRAGRGEGGQERGRLGSQTGGKD